MAGWVEKKKICRQLPTLSKGFLEISLFIIVWMSLPTSSYGQQPQGFISIDCGGPSNYMDWTTKLEWVTDLNSTYIMTGNNGTSTNSTYRFFPERRDKYCYELPTNPETTYLVRLSFTLVPEMTLPIEFIVSVNATNVFTMKYTSDVQYYYLSAPEGIFYSTGSVMYICLMPVQGVPFISTLELRPLEGSMYAHSGSNSQYLANLVRWNVGADPNAPPIIRSPDDKYDRYWYNIAIAELPVVNTSENRRSIAPDLNSAFYVPPKVMQDGWGGQPIWVTFLNLFPTDPNPVYVEPGDYAYVVLYAQALSNDPNRVEDGMMNVSLDGVPGPNLEVSAQRPSMQVTPNFILSANAINFSISAALQDWSIIAMNAVEVYAQYNFNFTTTIAEDDAAITVLKRSFSLMDWQGDPCTPVPHDWLSCSVSSTAAPPIRACGNETDQCIVQVGFLRSTYSVTALNLSKMPPSGFSLLQNSVASSPNMKLSSLTELSITGSEVTGPAFDFLINDFSGGVLTVLDFTNNEIDSLNRANNWAGLDNLVSLNLSQNNLTGYLSSFDNASFIESLQYLNLSYNAMTSLPTTWKNTTNNLTVLDLSHNTFVGKISSLDLLIEINAMSLQELYVLNNSFTGTISPFYFSALPNLKIAKFDGNSIQGTLNLSTWLTALQQETSTNSTSVTQRLFSFVGNSISNIVPSAQALDSTISSLRKSDPYFSANGILLGGNPYCNGAESETHQYLCRFKVDDPIIPPHHDNQTTMIIGICVGVGAAFLVACVVISAMWILWKKAKKQVHALEEIQRALADRKVQPPLFKYSALKSATRDFHVDNKLGQGGFGEVYKGVLPDDTKLAVKMLFNFKQFLDDFLNEVVLITGIKHRNLVQLKGCCITDEQRLLVYEYAEKGNLAQALWGSMAYGGLNWEQRFNICVGVARGLSYLHEELQPSIIHRDIKPENILLDDNLQPKIADFGLARHSSGDPSQAIYTRLAGTLGYFSPEYATQGQLSDKVDVYSYGVVVLEIVSGRKCIDYSQSPEAIFLKDWALNMYTKGLLLDILQPELRIRCEVSEAIRAIKIGLQCMHHDPLCRPSMSKVVTTFLGNMDPEVSLEENTNGHPFKDLLDAARKGYESVAPQPVFEGESPDLLSNSGDSESFQRGLEASSSGGNTPSAKSIIQLSPLVGR